MSASSPAKTNNPLSSASKTTPSSPPSARSKRNNHTYNLSLIVILTVRPTTYADIDALLAIFAYARQQMAADGNPTQWGNGYPEREQLEEDIQRGVSYVMEHEGFTRCGIIYTRNQSPRVAYQRISTTQL